MLLACLLFLPLGAGCLSEDEVEAQRRQWEAGIDTPEEIAVVAGIIEALEQNLGGIATQTLLERLAFYGTPGVTIAVVNQGAVEWVQAYGTYDLGSGTAMSRWSPLQAGSVSKPTTALAMLKLVEAGLLELDEPLNDALTSWQIPDNEFTTTEAVTLRRVLSHTAGVNNSGFLGYPQGVPFPSLLALLDGLPPSSHTAIRVVQTPGSDWMYSGGAYTILAQVLEDVTGEAFPDWLRANVLMPLNMSQSNFEQPNPDPRTVGTTIALLLGSIATSSYTYPERPAAGLWSTALDLGRLVVGIQESLAGAPDALLDSSIADGMITPQSPSPTAFDLGTPDPRMGLGLFLADGPDPDWFWHTGSNTGFTCIIVGDTQGLGFGAAVMTNSWPGGTSLAWEIVNGIADLYGWPGWNDWGI